METKKAYYSKIKKTRKETDDKWQEKCMGEGGYCGVCKANLANTCHHIIAKSISNRLRYELFNGIKICMGCHIAIHSSADPEVFRKLDEALGKERIKKLEELRREGVRTNLEWYQNNLERLKQL